MFLAFIYKKRKKDSDTQMCSLLSFRYIVSGYVLYFWDVNLLTWFHSWKMQLGFFQQRRPPIRNLSIYQRFILYCLSNFVLFFFLQEQENLRLLFSLLLLYFAVVGVGGWLNSKALKEKGILLPHSLFFPLSALETALKQILFDQILHQSPLRGRKIHKIANPQSSLETNRFFYPTR